MVDVTPESSFGKFWRDGLGTLVSMNAGFPPPVDGGAEASSAREPWEEH
jgi:hypothetical protein